VTSKRRASVGAWIAGGLALVFGLATLMEGGHVLFGGPEARAAAGKVVPFALVFNFSAGFGYVLAGVGTLFGRRWALWLAGTLAAGTLLVFAALTVHIAAGGAQETRTVLAMTLRSTFWIVQVFALRRILEGGSYA